MAHGGSISFGDSVVNGKISYSVTMNPLDNPSLENKQSIGKAYYEYTLFPSVGSTTYVSGGTLELEYKYSHGTVQKGDNVGWSDLGHYTTAAAAAADVETKRNAYTNYDTSLTEIYYEYDASTGDYRVIQIWFLLQYVSANGGTGTITGTMPTACVTGFSVSPSSMSLNVGETGNVSWTVDVYPVGSNPYYTVGVSSTGNAVEARINGSIIAKAVGSSVVTYSCAGYSATCLVTVETENPTPTYSITSVGTTTATASISNLTSGDNVVFAVYAGASGQNQISASGTATGSTMSLTVSGLSAGITYSAYITVNENRIGSTQFTTLEEPKPTVNFTYGTTTAKVDIVNLSVGKNVVFSVTFGAGSTVVASDSGTATGSSMSLSVGGLSAGTSYYASVQVDGGTYWSAQFTTDSLPSPTYDITSVTSSSATAFISNLTSGDNVVFIASTEGSGSAQVSASGQAQGSTMSLTIIGLSAGTLYEAYITVNEKSIGYRQFTTDSLPQASYNITNITTQSVTVAVDGAKSGSTVRLNVGSNTISGTADSDNKVALTVNNLEVGTEYTAQIYVEDVLLDDGVRFFTLFDWWKSTVLYGVTMSSYQVGDKTYPAPVTAEEWNRLVNLVNKKCGTGIIGVSRGEPMLAGSGQNIRLIADALIVPVNSKDVITAQFFLDLRDAVNAL